MARDITEQIQLIEEGIKKLSANIDISENVKNPIAVAAGYLGINVNSGTFTEGSKHSPASIDKQINKMYNEGLGLIIKTLVERNETLLDTFHELSAIYTVMQVHHYQTDNPNNTTTRLATPRQIYYDLFIAFNQGMNYVFEHKGAPASLKEFKKEYKRIRSQEILIV
ncbi:MAG: hypothetical protein WC916_02795 [Candidatus Woesearchaeota archaeon]